MRLPTIQEAYEYGYADATNRPCASWVGNRLYTLPDDHYLSIAANTGFMDAMQNIHRDDMTGCHS